MSGVGPIVYSGVGAFVFTYLIQQGKLLDFAATSVRPDLEHTKYDSVMASVAPVTEVIPSFTQYEPDVQTLFKCLGDQINKWALHGVRPQSFLKYYWQP